MTNAVSLFRSLLIYGLCLPLAIFLGYLLATPLDFTTFATVGLVLLLLTVPILLNWHRPLLILCWSTSVVVPVLPGSPPMWLTMAGISLLIAVLQRTLNKDMKFLHVPSVTWPLVFLAMVILVTAKFTGGIGFGSAGGSTGGGKRYVLMLGGILGYFALTSQRIPRNRAGLFDGTQIPLRYEQGRFLIIVEFPGSFGKIRGDADERPSVPRHFCVS